MIYPLYQNKTKLAAIIPYSGDSQPADDSVAKKAEQSRT